MEWSILARAGAQRRSHAIYHSRFVSGGTVRSEAPERWVSAMRSIGDGAERRFRRRRLGASTGRTERNTGALSRPAARTAAFLSTNLGVQSKLFSPLFLTASLLAIWQGYDRAGHLSGQCGEYRCSLQTRSCP